MQNTYHFAVAALDWMEIYVPRYNGQMPSVSEVADIVGTFVYDIKQANHLAQCGVPVWIVGGFTDVRRICVDELLLLSDPSHIPLELTPASGTSVIFCGPSGIESLQCMIWYYAHSLAGTNPFVCSTPSTSSSARPSSSCPSSASRSLNSESSCDIHWSKPCKCDNLFID